MVNHNIRVCILFEFKLGHNASTATRNINQAWGNGTLIERTTQRWFTKFRLGDESLEDEEGRGRPPAIDNDRLKTLVEENSRQTVRELSEELGVDAATVSRHLASIGKVKKLDKWVPHELNDSQKNCRYQICSSLLLRNEKDPFLGRIVTCDEKWILYDNRKRSAQWLDYDELPRHMPKPNLHPKKVMVSVWWSKAGVIHYSFLEPGETITAAKYCREIEIVNQKLLITQPALVNRKGPIVLHDNLDPTFHLSPSRS